MQTELYAVCRGHPGRRMHTVMKLVTVVIAGATLAGCNPEGAVKAASTVSKETGALQRIAKGLGKTDSRLLLDAGRSMERTAEPKFDTHVTLPTTGWHVRDEAPFTSGCSVPGAAAGWKENTETGLLTFGGCRGGVELARRHQGQ